MVWPMLKAMKSTKFRARLAWCREGTWGHKTIHHEEALHRCVRLMLDEISYDQANEVNERLQSMLNYTTEERILLRKILVKIYNPRLATSSNYYGFRQFNKIYNEQISSVVFRVHVQGLMHCSRSGVFEYGPFPPPAAVAPPPDPRVKAQSPDRACVVCMTYEKTHAFMPCGHLCVCEVCSKRAFQERHACPVCHAGATERRVIYS